MNIKKILLSASLTTLMVLGGVVGGYAIATTNNIEEADDSVKLEVVSQKGMIIKKLKTTNNTDGSVTKSFTYEVTPSYATNKDISVAVKYKDGTDCSSVVSASVDTATQTISVTCKSAFSKQVILTATASDGSGVTATMTIDYEKKITALNRGEYDSCTIALFNDEAGVADFSLEGADIPSNEFYYATYSLYSVDKNYTFKLDAYNLEIGGSEMPGTTLAVPQVFCNALEYAIENESTIDSNLLLQEAEELGISEDDFCSYMLEATTGGIATMMINCYVKATCNQDSSISVINDEISFYIEVNEFDFSSYSASVSGLELETTTLLY